MKSQVKGDFRKLNKFVENISTEAYVKVGIMGEKNARDGGASTNATLGAIHELGSMTMGIPPRSFLRMPLEKESKQILAEAAKGALALMVQGKMTLLLKRLGIAAENAIQRGFESGGFGLWKSLKQTTIQRKRSDAILIDTGQLRRSITSKVEGA